MNDDVFVCDLMRVDGKKRICARIDMEMVVRRRSAVGVARSWKDMVVEALHAGLLSMHMVLDYCGGSPSKHRAFGRLAAAAAGAAGVRVAHIAGGVCWAHT